MRKRFHSKTKTFLIIANFWPVVYAPLANIIIYKVTILFSLTHRWSSRHHTLPLWTGTDRGGMLLEKALLYQLLHPLLLQQGKGHHMHPQVWALGGPRHFLEGHVGVWVLLQNACQNNCQFSIKSCSLMFFLVKIGKSSPSVIKNITIWALQPPLWKCAFRSHSCCCILWVKMSNTRDKLGSIWSKKGDPLSHECTELTKHSLKYYSVFKCTTFNNEGEITVHLSRSLSS